MDSIKSLSLHDEKFLRLHSKVPKSGHIHKGHSIVSHNSTIPTKYETYVVENSDNRGFNSTAKRFNYEYNENTSPGVGYYVGQQELTQESPSFSKLGTGSFASRNRFVSYNPGAEIPAPNTYYIKSADSKLDFNRANYSKNFHPDIATKTENKTSILPAPNLYNILSKIGEKNNISSFKSTTNRIMLPSSSESNKPGPGQYSISKADNLVNNNQKCIQSVFKSKSKRDPYKPAQGPGPSEYNVIDENKWNKSSDNRFVRKHYLCLAASAIKLPPTPPLPGPGKYNVSKTIGEPNHYMSSSMFTSTSSRWTKPGTLIGLGTNEGQNTCSNTDFPSPAHYQPCKPMKQSFHYNVSNKWV